MLRLALLLPLAGTMFLFQSCVTDPITCIRVSSLQITESRDIRDFKGITLYEPANLIITQGAEYAVKMTGPQNVVELTNTTLVDGYLVISSEDCFNGNDELAIEVTAPEFELVYISSRATLETIGSVQGNNIQLELLGEISGSATLEMDSVFALVSGKGNLNFSGSAKYQQLDLAGELKIAAFSLITEHTVINLAGLAACEVTANNLLEVNIAGSGNVNYKGDPQIDSNITGTGKIINSN
jgi:hemin uptake protein HemP